MLEKELTDQEALNLHAEIKALQTTLGLSYKDAAHRLYMAEVERMKVEKHTELAFTKICETIDKTVVNDLITPIESIDNGECD
jgi:hypothetical protein